MVLSYPIRFSFLSVLRWYNSPNLRCSQASVISTHILTKRMTRLISIIKDSLLFQLTSSRGGWPRTVHARILRRGISTHILTRRMTPRPCPHIQLRCHFNSHPHEEDDVGVTYTESRFGRISTHILTRRMTVFAGMAIYNMIISTHILTRRMTAILNKIFSFKIKLYIHYNILFAIFYIYNSILYSFSSPKCSYSGANDSANYCSLAFRTPRFPVPSLQIHFP